MKEYLSIINSLSITGEINREIESHFPKYGIYKNIGQNTVRYYCTSCHQFVNADIKVKHNENFICINCLETVMAKAIGFNRQNVQCKGSFVIYYSVNGTLYAKAVRVEQYFAPCYEFELFQRNLEPKYRYHQYYYYVFERKSARRYNQISHIENINGKWEWIYEWAEMKTIRNLPMYSGMGYVGFDNAIPVNIKAIQESDLKYSEVLSYSDSNAYDQLTYLLYYVKRNNLEYIQKSGSTKLTKAILENGYMKRAINWKSNNLLKMLNLNRTEFKLLQGKIELYETYIWWRKEYPKGSPEQLIAAAEKFGMSLGTVTNLIKKTGYNIFRITRYLTEQNIGSILYRDYIQQCIKLKYNLHDTAICFPHNFHEMHTRLSDIIRYKADEETNHELTSRLVERQQFEFSYKSLILIQPKDVAEIIGEGKALCHCVGGYAERHAKGQTNIFFIRQRDKPDTPYYTIEVSNKFNIIQCHGYKNDKDGKPDEIKEFEQVYTKYLEELRNGNNIDRTA